MSNETNETIADIVSEVRREVLELQRKGAAESPRRMFE